MTSRGSERSRGKRRLLQLALALTMASTGCNSIFGIREGAPRQMCVDHLMIDDMEDNVADICQTDGRNGAWYDLGDTSPTRQIDPPLLGPFKLTNILDGSRGASQYAARFSGSGFTMWGAKMGFSLKTSDGTAAQPDDVSNLGGITFWMKSNVPVSVEFPTLETARVASGGECVDTATATNCDNYFFFQVTVPAPEWRQFFVPFNALAQGVGGNATWNPRHLLNIQFGAPAGTTFEVWIDDIAFDYCPGPDCQPTCTDPDFLAACPEMGGLHSSCRPTGTDCAAIATWCADPLMIDDMEDADAWICPSGGRQGGWSTNAYDSAINPTPGMDFKQTLIPGGRVASHHAAHIAGTGITGLSRMGFELNTSAAGEVNYDGSMYDGIKFSLKSDVPVIVGFTSPETLPVSQNGTCDLSPTEENCNHHFEFVTSTTGGEWLDYQVPFSALKQAADHDAPVSIVPPNATWDASRLRAIAFLTSSPDFDVWVDDIAFYTCGAKPCLPTCTGNTPVSCAASGTRPAGCWPAGTGCASLPDLVP